MHSPSAHSHSIARLVLAGAERIAAVPGNGMISRGGWSSRVTGVKCRGNVSTRRVSTSMGAVPRARCSPWRSSDLPRSSAALRSAAAVSRVMVNWTPPWPATAP